MVDNGEKIKAGKVLVKIPRRSSKSGDITGGLKNYRVVRSS
jgi:DNA-directed RNA polymerase subunit beta'